MASSRWGDCKKTTAKLWKQLRKTAIHPQRKLKKKTIKSEKHFLYRIWNTDPGTLSVSVANPCADCGNWGRKRDIARIDLTQEQVNKGTGIPESYEVGIQNTSQKRWNFVVHSQKNGFSVSNTIYIYNKNTMKIKWIEKCMYSDHFLQKLVKHLCFKIFLKIYWIFA